MGTEEFESLIEGSPESESLEYKGACDWSTRTFAKDILAMSNIQDGGFIVIGIKDRTLERLGLSNSQLASFDIEKMQDQMANFADPFVSFTLYNIKDSVSKKYVVIRVFEFPEIPVVSRIDSHDVHKGIVYYRTRQHRPASEAITNSYDMRDVLDRAAIKLMSKRRSQGYRVEDDNTNKAFYEQELGDL